MRLYKCFKTTEERKAWETERKKDNPKFRVCMRMTARELEKDMYMEKGTLSEYKTATIYTYD